MSRDTRIVGERGQITIPKGLRERFGIRGGDEVVVRAEDDQIVIAQRTVDDRLQEGYSERADRDRLVASDRPAPEVPNGGDGDDQETPADAPTW